MTRWTWKSRSTLVGVALALTGCGARASAGVAQEDAASGRGEAPAPERVPRGGTSRVGANAPPEVAVQVPEEAALPNPGCDAPFGLGELEGRPCPYLAGGLCYEDQRCACDRYCTLGSACVIHGFLSPGRTQRIDCVEL